MRRGTQVSPTTLVWVYFLDSVLGSLVFAVFFSTAFSMSEILLESFQMKRKLHFLKLKGRKRE